MRPIGRGPSNTRSYQERSPYHSAGNSDPGIMPEVSPYPSPADNAPRDGYASRSGRGRYEQNPYALRERNSERLGSPSGRSHKRSSMGSITPVAPLDQPDDAWGGHAEPLENRTYKKRD